jgi:hypothetical protein
MAAKRKLGDCDRVLIVEGYSDLLFYAEFLEWLGNYDSVFIQHFNGKADLNEKLEDFVTPQLLAEKGSIGIIVDADEQPEGAFAAVRDKIAQLTTLEIPAPGRWIAGPPKIGAFIAPDPATPGEIETLVWRAWSADSKNAVAKDCIDAFIACMAADGHKAKSPDKGLIGALLAIQSDDDPRLGPGARNRVFDFDRPEFAALRMFLSEF